MPFYYLDPERGRLGPWSLVELQQLFNAGVISRATPIAVDHSGVTMPFGNLWDQMVRAGAIPPALSDEFVSSGARGLAGTPLGGSSEYRGPPPLPGRDPTDFTGRARDDIRVILPHLTLPLDQLRGFRWFEDKRALAIAGIGLLPLAIYAVFRQPWQLGNAFWAMALYFSILWALFFHYAFPTPEAEIRTAALCFFTTGLLSVSALLLAYQIWPLTQVPVLIKSGDWLLEWFAFVFGVGVPEELCKALVLFLILWRQGPLRPQAVLFYGLMAGLGFGIYEGVKYQTQQNFEYAIRVAGQPDARFAAEYYLLNLVRLTTLPFLHAIWTGMAGYFIGFAGQYPGRGRGLVIVAIGLPAFLHGTYNSFGGAVSIIVALISVLALNLYLATTVQFEKLLKQRR